MEFALLVAQTMNQKEAYIYLWNFELKVLRNIEKQIGLIFNLTYAKKHMIHLVISSHVYNKILSDL